MTTPKTVALAPAEWKDLVVNNAVRLHGQLVSVDCPDAVVLTAIAAHLDRMKALVLAWHRSPLAPPPEEITTPAAHAAPTPALPPKRKGGWPRGKKRGEPIPSAAETWPPVTTTVNGRPIRSTGA